MFNLKSYILKQATNVKVVKSNLGQVTLKADIIMKIIGDYKQYEGLIKKAIRVLHPIHIITFDYDNKVIIVNYNEHEIKENKVLEWIKIVINVLIDNYDLIKKYIETAQDDLVNVIEDLLKDRLMEF